MGNFNFASDTNKNIGGNNNYAGNNNNNNQALDDDFDSEWNDWDDFDEDMWGETDVVSWTGGSGGSDGGAGDIYDNFDFDDAVADYTDTSTSGWNTTTNNNYLVENRFDDSAINDWMQNTSSAITNNNTSFNEALNSLGSGLNSAAGQITKNATNIGTNASSFEDGIGEVNKTMNSQFEDYDSMFGDVDDDLGDLGDATSDNADAASDNADAIGDNASGINDLGDSVDDAQQAATDNKGDIKSLSDYTDEELASVDKGLLAAAKAAEEGQDADADARKVLAKAATVETKRVDKSLSQQATATSDLSDETAESFRAAEKSIAEVAGDLLDQGIDLTGIISKESDAASDALLDAQEAEEAARLKAVKAIYEYTDGEISTITDYSEAVEKGSLDADTTILRALEDYTTTAINTTSQMQKDQQAAIAESRNADIAQKEDTSEQISGWGKKLQEEADAESKYLSNEIVKGDEAQQDLLNKTSIDIEDDFDKLTEGFDDYIETVSSQILGIQDQNDSDKADLEAQFAKEAEYLSNAITTGDSLSQEEIEARTAALMEEISNYDEETKAAISGVESKIKEGDDAIALSNKQAIDDVTGKYDPLAADVSSTQKEIDKLLAGQWPADTLTLTAEEEEAAAAYTAGKKLEASVDSDDAKNAEVDDEARYNQEYWAGRRAEVDAIQDPVARAEALSTLNQEVIAVGMKKAYSGDYVETADPKDAIQSLRATLMDSVPVGNAQDASGEELFALIGVAIDAGVAEIVTSETHGFFDETTVDNIKMADGTVIRRETYNPEVTLPDGTTFMLGDKVTTYYSEGIKIGETTGAGEDSSTELSEGRGEHLSDTETYGDQSGNPSNNSEGNNNSGSQEVTEEVDEEVDEEGAVAGVDLPMPDNLSDPESSGAYGQDGNPFTMDGVTFWKRVKDRNGRWIYQKVENYEPRRNQGRKAGWGSAISI